MITVTSASVAKDLKNVTISITVLPQEKEKSALDFAKRMRTDLRTDIKRRLPVKSIPFVEVEIDEGEKNRQKIESILLQDRIKNPRIDTGAEGEEELL
jgi:ribosome-binding factor A